MLKLENSSCCRGMMAGISVLQDLLDAMSVAELTEALGLRSIRADWHVQASDSTALSRTVSAHPVLHDYLAPNLAHQGPWEVVTVSRRHCLVCSPGGGSCSGWPSAIPVLFVQAQQLTWSRSQASCAVTGDGLTEGLEWVAQRCRPNGS